MKNRKPFVVFLLSVLTFGLYDIYWLLRVKSVLNKKTKVHTPPVIVLLLAFAIFIGSFMFYQSKSSSNRAIATAITNGSKSIITSNPSGVSTAYDILLVSITGLAIVGFYWNFKFSKAINKYTQGQNSVWRTTVLLLIAQPLGLAFAQQAINSASSKKDSLEHLMPALPGARAKNTKEFTKFEKPSTKKRKPAVIKKADPVKSKPLAKEDKDEKIDRKLSKSEAKKIDAKKQDKAKKPLISRVKLKKSTPTFAPIAKRSPIQAAATSFNSMPSGFIATPLPSYKPISQTKTSKVAALRAGYGPTKTKAIKKPMGTVVQAKPPLNTTASIDLKPKKKDVSPGAVVKPTIHIGVYSLPRSLRISPIAARRIRGFNGDQPIAVKSPREISVKEPTYIHIKETKHIRINRSKSIQVTY